MTSSMQHVPSSGKSYTPPFAAEELIEAARHDKKRHGDAIDLVLPLGVASCTIQTVTLDQFFDLIRAGLSDKELTQA